MDVLREEIKISLSHSLHPSLSLSLFCITERRSSFKMLAMVSSWLTPTFLFVTMNVVIATIVITSRFSHRNSPQTHQLGSQNAPQLVRAPSLLNRVRSFNFSFHSFDVNASSGDLDSTRSAQLVRAPSILNRLMSGKFAPLDRSEQTSDSGTEINRPSEPESRAVQSNPEQKTTLEVRGDNLNSGGEVPVKAPEKMKKSASEKLGRRDEEEREEIEKRRPSTVRVDKRGSAEEEIDAKADDFINKFKQQLKLQRLDSLLRYRDMLKGN